MNDYEREHNAFLRRFGAECAVLLKSDGAFPLAGPCRLALFGSGARRTVKGGTGSGEVNSRFFVTVEDGLRAAGFTLAGTDWMDNYDRLYASARKDFVRGLHRQAKEHHTLAIFESMGAVMPEPEHNIPLRGGGEAAVYVLSRISGEGSDRRAEAGDIFLSETEKRDILALMRRYDKFLLVLNVGGAVDLSPVAEVGNILLLSQLGVETGDILADLMLGKSTPSGRLTTTWSAWADYPTIGEFGGKDETRYREGIYVGYRYFDSVGKKALFPFGFGLSYTDFSITAGGVHEENGTVSVTVSVQNTGRYVGKQVVQLYVSAPQGRLDKPFQSLAAFGKTDALQPGGTQELTLSFDLRALSSYDGQQACWILEQGDYILRLGASSADTEAIAVVRLNGEIAVRKVKNCLGSPDFTDWQPESRPAAAEVHAPVIPVSAAAFETETVDYTENEEIDPLAETLSDEELCYLGVGGFDPGLGALSVIGEASRSVAGAAGETTDRLKEKGVPPLVMADGPAGLRLSRQYTVDEKGAHAFGNTMPESMLELMPAPAALAIRALEGKRKARGEIREQYCTALPIGTAIAQSWNLDFAERCGDIVGDEMERFGVQLWLAPALNIHRDLRCGRNFEYFSEDPLISGRFAAAIIRGVQKHPGCAATVKHFAANNQETNRYASNSQVSERALREIYLRGFEIAVKEGGPLALMTSYNLINGVHSSERRDLLQDVLRAEFGYTGVVMTDWIIAAMTGKQSRYPAPNAARIAAAGNDLTMPGGAGDFKALMRGLKNGTVTRGQLMRNATRILRLAKKLTEKK